VLFPSSGPETFAFTLSEAWSLGRAVLVPPIGALAERVSHEGIGWVMEEAEWRDESCMLDRILDLVSPAQQSRLAQMQQRSSNVELPTIEAMAAATISIYEHAMAGGSRVRQPVDRIRVAEAFGYRGWTPPERAAAPLATSPATDVQNSRIGLAHAARQLRQTSAGRVLYRLVPMRVRAAMKARLS
jgi:hypothetical protein